MPLTDLFPLMIPRVLWLVVGTGLGTVIALAFGALMVQKKAVPVIFTPSGPTTDEAIGKPMGMSPSNHQRLRPLRSPI